MTEEEKLHDEIFKEISSLTYDVVDFYFKREKKCIKNIEKKIKIIPNLFIQILGYMPITHLLYEQYRILFDSLCDKNITKEEYKEFFFETLKKGLDAGLYSVLDKINSIKH